MMTALKPAHSKFGWKTHVADPLSTYFFEKIFSYRHFIVTETARAACLKKLPEIHAL